MRTEVHAGGRAGRTRGVAHDRRGLVRNTATTAAVLAGMAGLVVLVGSWLGGTGGALIGLVLGLAMVGGSYWFSDRIALRAAGARPLSPGEAPQLTAMVAELAARAGIPTPRLYLSPSPQPNAFATGRDPGHAVVAVTQGLLDLLPPEEVRGVLAHELSHVSHRDILLTSVAAALATGISAIANIASFRMFFGGAGDDEEGPGLLGTLVLIVVAPLAATLLQLALSRGREFDADRRGAELAGDGEPLARALTRIDGYARSRPMAIAPAQAQAWIVNPLGGAALARLFSTHPPLDDRLARLRHLRGDTVS